MSISLRLIKAFRTTWHSVPPGLIFQCVFAHVDEYDYSLTVLDDEPLAITPFIIQPIMV